MFARGCLFLTDSDRGERFNGLKPIMINHDLIQQISQRTIHISCSFSCDLAAMIP